MTDLTTRVWTSQFLFFFLSLVYARVLVNQFFFFPLFFFWFVIGFRHDLAHFKEDHSKSKVLGCMTTRHFNSCRYDMLMRVLGEQTVALHAPKRSDIEAKWSTYNQYTLEERVKMGRCGAKSDLSKVTRHFSLLLVGKLTCSLHHSGYIYILFFFWGIESPKLMPAKFSRYTVLCGYGLSIYAVLTTFSEVSWTMTIQPGWKMGLEC